MCAAAAPVLLALVKLCARYLAGGRGACRCTARLAGRTALITGANSGLGLETARELARRGARVLLACRDPERARAARDDIVASTGNSDVHTLPLDLADESSVRRLAARVLADEPALDLLVLNAGVAGLRRRAGPDGVDPVMRVNHLSHFLLTRLLLPRLVASAPSRVVVVSSLAHRCAALHAERPCVARGGHWTRYCNSKLCNILFVRALAARAPPAVEVHAAHPGVVLTDIFRRVPQPWRRILLAVVRALFKSAAEGAQTSIHLCLAPALGPSGGYWADCAPATASRAASDAQLAERVWDESCSLTGVSVQLDAACTESAAMNAVC